MKQVTVSAPGKLMLLGEHAVVYNHPCLVTAVGQRLFATVATLNSELRTKNKNGILRIDAEDIGVTGYEKPMKEVGKGEIHKGVKFVEIAVKNFLAFQGDALESQQGINITTRSEFSSQFGFGSSSASTVCTIKALAELFSVKLAKKQLFDLAYKTVLDIQGKGSGFDVAAAVYGGTLYFVTGGKVIKQIISPRHSGKRSASRISIGKGAERFWTSQDDDFLPLIVGYSGIKADTVTLINQVAEKAKTYPKVVNTIYKQIAEIVNIARIALVKKDWATLGELMNINQGYLESLGVSTGKLSAMVYAARDAGAYGAKLSGAGGGDCIIALTEISDKKKAISSRQKVIRAIEKVGGEVIEVEVNAEGVRDEK